MQTGIDPELAQWMRVVEYELGDVLSHGLAAYGGHRSSEVGWGGRFEGYRSFLSRPDVRRIDPVATQRAGADPAQSPLVRTYRAKLSVPVSCLTDVSGSMAFAGKHREAAKLALLIGCSAAAFGDRFSLIAYADRIEHVTSSAHGVGAALEAACAVWDLSPCGQSAALEQAVEELPLRRGLVVWISDFHLPLPRIAWVLEALFRHRRVLIGLLPPSEADPSERFGWAEIEDIETGTLRDVWVRPSWVARVRESYRQHQQAVGALASQYGAHLVWLPRAEITPVMRVLQGGNGYAA